MTAILGGVAGIIAALAGLAGVYAPDPQPVMQETAALRDQVVSLEKSVARLEGKVETLTIALQANESLRARSAVARSLLSQGRVQDAARELE